LEQEQQLPLARVTFLCLCKEALLSSRRLIKVTKRSALPQPKAGQARPASGLPRCALQVRVHDGDSRKGLGRYAAKSGAVASRRLPARRGEAVLRLFPASPAPAANGAHPCAPPFGFFPGPSAAAEGNPVSQKQQQSNSSRAEAEQSSEVVPAQLFNSCSRATARSPSRARARAVWRLELVQPIAGLIQHEQKPNDAMKPLAEAIRGMARTGRKQSERRRL
jgi:hypothetical protein